MTRLIYPTRNDAAFPCAFFFCKRCLIDAKDQPYSKQRRLSYQSDLSSQRSNSPRFRSASNGPRSVYSSSSSTDSYRGGGGGGGGVGAGQRGRAASRDQFQQHQRQPYYRDVKVKHMSPRSSTLSGAPTTTSESSFSDPLGSSYPRGDAAVSSISSAHSLQNRRHPALSSASSASSTSGSVNGDRRGAPPPPMPSLRRNISSSSALSHSSNHSLPQRQLSQRSFVSSVGSAYEADFGQARPGGDNREDSDDDSDSSSSEDSSSGLSESESDDDDEAEPASVAVVQHQTAVRNQLSPNSKLLAKLRQIEMFADDETGLVQLPPPRRVSSQPQPQPQHPAVVSNAGVGSSAFHGDRLKYISTYQANKNGGIGMLGSEAPHSGHASYGNRGGYGNASSAAIGYSSSSSAPNGYPSYATSSAARGSPFPGAPVHTRAPPPPSAAPSYSQQREHELMRERLMQINMAAEATYLMAKYNHSGMPDYSSRGAGGR